MTAQQVVLIQQRAVGRSWAELGYPSTAKVWQTLNIGKSPRIPNNLIISGVVRGQMPGHYLGVVCQTLPVLVWPHFWWYKLFTPGGQRQAQKEWPHSESAERTAAQRERRGGSHHHVADPGVVACMLQQVLVGGHVAVVFVHYRVRLPWCCPSAEDALAVLRDALEDVLAMLRDALAVLRDALENLLLCSETLFLCSETPLRTFLLCTETPLRRSCCAPRRSCCAPRRP